MDQTTLIYFPTLWRTKPEAVEFSFVTGDNVCFYGKCMYCKGEKDGVCAEGTKLEGVIVLWLPPNYSQLHYQRHPWGRTYREGKKAP